jgi:hypothetical protein
MAEPRFCEQLNDCLPEERRKRPIAVQVDRARSVKGAIESRREPSFVAGTHLGKLARHLRAAGFDTLYGNGWCTGRAAATLASRPSRTHRRPAPRAAPRASGPI